MMITDASSRDYPLNTYCITGGLTVHDRTNGVAQVSLGLIIRKGKKENYLYQVTLNRIPLNSPSFNRVKCEFFFENSTKIFLLPLNEREILIKDISKKATNKYLADLGNLLPCGNYGLKELS